MSLINISYTYNMSYTCISLITFHFVINDNLKILWHTHAFSNDTYGYFRKNKRYNYKVFKVTSPQGIRTFYQVYYNKVDYKTLAYNEFIKFFSVH